MTKKKKFQILIALLIIMMVGVIALIAWIANEKRAVTIYDFARTIQYDDKSNYALTQNDLAETEILAADVKEEYITDPQEAIGKYITGTAYKGQHIVKNQIQTDPTYTEIGGISELAQYRKFYLPVNYDSAFAGDIKAGQSVDLIWYETGTGLSTERTNGVPGSDNGISYNQARIIMYNIPVYQVYTADGSVYSKKTTDPETLNKFKGTNAASLEGESGDEPSGTPAYVALSVTVDQYEELYVRKQTGTLAMVCRFDESADADTDGYIVMKDGLANVFTGKGNLEYEHGIDETEDTNSELQVSKPNPYTFMRRLSLFNMTDEQSTRYRALYTRFVEFAQLAGGTEWETNSPELLTATDLANAAQEKGEDAMTQYLAWQTDVENFAEEITGSKQVMPW